jgi:hypothetical protein
MADTEASETNDRSEEVFVRDIVAVELVPLDDVMESPEEWNFSYSNEEMKEGRHLRAGRDRDQGKPVGHRLGEGRCC